MKNILLTGERRVGKSTAMNKILSGLNGTVSGYRTYFDRYDSEGPRRLLIAPAMGGGAVEIGAALPGQRPSVDMDVFLAAATEYLQPAGDCAYILMDELGYLESSSESFRKAVWQALDSPLPVLGVMRLDAPGWVGDIAKRPDTLMLTVTMENRDALPDTVLRLLGRRG